MPRLLFTDSFAPKHAFTNDPLIYSPIMNHFKKGLLQLAGLCHIVWNSQFAQILVHFMKKCPTKRFQFFWILHSSLPMTLRSTFIQSKISDKGSYSFNLAPICHQMHNFHQKFFIFYTSTAKAIVSFYFSTSDK